jgi:hypothetical protein
MKNRETTRLEKKAYGQPTVEIIFNEPEFVKLLEDSGFIIVNVIESIPYDLKGLLGEQTVTKTYVCEVKRA